MERIIKILHVKKPCKKEEDVKRYLAYTMYHIFFLKIEGLEGVHKIYTRDPIIYEILLYVFEKDKIKIEEEETHYLIDVYGDEKDYISDFYQILLDKNHSFRVDNEEHIPKDK